MIRLKRIPSKSLKINYLRCFQFFIPELYHTPAFESFFLKNTKMKLFSTLLGISFLLSIAVISGCKKDNDFDPADLSRYYRLKSYEVAVVPEQRMVQVLFQVTDYYKKGVADLKKEDFIVSENKGNLDSEADLRVGRNSIPFELKTVLLLDISRSVEGQVPQIKKAAKALIEMKLPEQQIALYTFDSKSTRLKNFSKDKASLLAAIDNIPETDLVNSTNLYGAILDVADLWEDHFSIDGIVDGSLVIFTDGRHNASQTLTLSTAIAALGNRHVYIAALDSPDLDEAALKALANSYDRYYEAKDIEGLTDMFLDIQSQIQSLSNSIYFLYYQSPISDPTPYNNELFIEVKGNLNTNSDGWIQEYFDSKGFGG